MIKVCIVDDHTIIREGLIKLLNGSNKVIVVAGAGSIKEFEEHFDNPDWDILILDLSLPDGSGLDLIKELRKRKNEKPILILTMHDEDQYGLRAFKAGADGYLTKDCAGDMLITAIEKLHKGEKFVSSKMAEKMVTYLGTKNSEPSIESLSDREYEILIYIGSGKTISEIGKKLSLSVKTISTYRTRILDKLNLRNNSDIIHYCIKHTLFTTDVK